MGRPTHGNRPESYPRMLDKNVPPTEAKILKTIGIPNAWQDLKGFLEEHYDFQPELAFYGKKYGWTVRYRKSGKTLCSLFPETGAFSVLIVLGKKQATETLAKLDTFTPPVQKIIEETKQLHDGSWLWIRVFGSEQVEDIKSLLKLKRKPVR